MANSRKRTNEEIEEERMFFDYLELAKNDLSAISNVLGNLQSLLRMHDSTTKTLAVLAAKRGITLDDITGVSPEVMATLNPASVALPPVAQVVMPPADKPILDLGLLADASLNAAASVPVPPPAVAPAPIMMEPVIPARPASPPRPFNLFQAADKPVKPKKKRKAPLTRDGQRRREAREKKKLEQATMTMRMQ